MGRHARPGPSDGPSRPTGPLDPADPLAAYYARRQPPTGLSRRQRPLHGGGAHVRPWEARVLEEWDGFGYAPVGVAPDLAAACAWVAAGDVPSGRDGG